ncbi:MAG: TerB family tellurite resistance protein [Alistipes sp.]|nr:TerB family tellurite resistance protein [Candidatus Alistipes equi]
MKTAMETAAALMALAVTADGSFKEGEKSVLGDIASLLEFPNDKFIDTVENFYKEIRVMNHNAVTKYLHKHASEVDNDDLALIFEAYMEIVLSDGTMSFCEVESLLRMADALGISHADIILMVANLAKDTPKLEIDFE